MSKTQFQKKLLKKFFALATFFLLSGITANAQQFSLYNSRTLYDSFENPSQRAYQVDTSKRIAFNFFIPTISFNTTFSGPAESSFKTLIYNGLFNGRDLVLGQNRKNILTLNSNNYIAMLRILKSVKNYQEIGVSWQIRSDTRAEVTNEVFAVFDDYRLFEGNATNDLLNVNAYNQNYHQFSLAYRQNPTKRLAVGAKFSVLSGISYSNLQVSKSDVEIDELADIMKVSLAGRFRSSFKFDKFQNEMIKPNFKNPGFSLTASASYKYRNGWFVMWNLKDVGFIKWNKESFEYDFDTGKMIINNASRESADERLADSIDRKISLSSKNKSYLSALNGKLEVLFNKNFGNYRPNLILSKSVYYKGGDIALVNNFHVKNYVFTGMADYNTNGFLQLGGQFMVKKPNFEFYGGSDHLVKTVEIFKNATNNGSEFSKGYTGASFYMGLAFKFGRILEHPANATQIPGFTKDPDGGFLKKLIKKKD
ncbi:DUF5723 family protein [Daejeonella sp.]|jgi:hypothetical protein|uniref:DUF5723 family protein n=1 Tax=Daejeonella sp. TaxID=2805397 RepID=UPI0037C181D3